MVAEEVTALFIRHYVIMAFIASMGVIQTAASYSGLRGLWLMPNRLTTRLLGVLLIVGAIVFFYTAPLWTEGPWAADSVGADSSTREVGKAAWSDLPAARNVFDVDGGMDGNDQALWFSFGAAAAVLATVAISSVINRRLRGRPSRDDLGLEALRVTTYAASLGRSLSYWASQWRGEVAGQFQEGVHRGGLRDIGRAMRLVRRGR